MLMQRDQSRRSKRSAMKKECDRPFVSLQRKLERLTTRVMLLVGGLVMAIGMIMFILEFQRRLHQIRMETEASLVGKGRLLARNNSIALRRMVEDNAFAAIGELVESTVREDEDVLYGIYMDTLQQPWVTAGECPFCNSGQHGKEPSRLQDSVSLWAAESSMPNFKVVRVDGDKDCMEFIAPIVSMNSRLGTIRYGIGTDQMRSSIRRMQTFFTFYMGAYIGAFILAGFGVFWLGIRRSRKQAGEITRPLSDLRGAADRIAGGNYETPVAIAANDEVGVLAENIEFMRRTVQDYTQNLKTMVSQRTAQLEATQKELVTKAHQAGMADIAIGTLHNIGNILNSIKVSVQMQQQMIDDSPVMSLRRANQLLRQNIDSLETFLLSDPRGGKLMEYYLKLDGSFDRFIDKMREHGRRLSSKVNAIQDVIFAQQSYANTKAMVETGSLEEIVDDAIVMQRGSIEKYGITVEKDVPRLPGIRIQKTKMIHVLINLINNAKDAMMEMPPEARKLVFRAAEENGRVALLVTDTGIGIRPENLKRVFSHGFTTKKDGHGFGLHSSANYIREMDGEMRVESEGSGKGATFIITLPVARG